MGVEGRPNTKRIRAINQQEQMCRERPQIWENTRTDGRIYQGDALKHTFTKKYHNVSFWCVAKGRKGSTTADVNVCWMAVGETRKRRKLNYRKRSKHFFPPWNL